MGVHVTVTQSGQLLTIELLVEPVGVALCPWGAVSSSPPQCFSGVPVVREAKVVGLRSGPHWAFINAGFHAIKRVWVETKFAVTGHFLVIQL